MSSIFPFPGWRYDPGKVDLAKVTAPPYDIIDSDLQDRLYARDGHNVVRLIYGRINSTDGPADNRYTRAASHLDAWRGDMLFLQDKPAIYLYEQTFTQGEEEFIRRGFFARVRLSDWGREGIYPHEKTLAGPKQDRLELMRATRGNLEPIFGLLADPAGEVGAALTTLVDYPPVTEIVDDDGVRNRLWVVDEPVLLHQVLSLMPKPEIFIADGHHRYETALAYQTEIREKMRAAGQVPPLRGDLDCDYILMYIVPDSDPGLVIWPTHRIVHGLKDFKLDQFLASCERNFTCVPVTREKLEKELAQHELPAFGFACGDQLYLLALKSRKPMEALAGGQPPEWTVLDVAVLHTLLMDAILGIDEEKLLRKENIIYTKSIDEALDHVKKGTDGAQAAFILRGTPMEQVRDIAASGAVMPQKSTYFYPKPLSGLVFHWFW